MGCYSRTIYQYSIKDIKIRNIKQVKDTMNTNIPRFIIVAGDVGAGKTTTSGLLYLYFLRKKIQIRYLYPKSFGAMEPLLKILAILAVPKEIRDYFYSRGARSGAVIEGAWKQGLKKLMPILFVLDLLSFVLYDLLLVKIPAILGSITILEEYILGFMADYIYFYYNKLCSKNITNVVLIILVKLLPRDAIILYLSAPYNELRSRWYQRQSIPVNKIYIASQRISVAILKSIQYKYKIKSFNTVLPLREVLKGVLSLIMS